MYSLSRNFWNCNLDSSVKLAYAGVDFHASSSWVCLMENALLAVAMCISYFFSIKRVCGLWVILNKLVVLV